jgi:hypothetical protein
MSNAEQHPEAKNGYQESRGDYTHIINLRGSEYAYFASNFKDNGDSVEFTTTTKDGQTFRRTLNKSEIRDIAEKM